MRVPNINNNSNSVYISNGIEGIKHERVKLSRKFRTITGEVWKFNTSDGDNEIKAQNSISATGNTFLIELALTYEIHA